MNNNGSPLKINFFHVLISIVCLIIFVVLIKTVQTPLNPEYYEHQPTYLLYEKDAPILNVALISDLDKESKMGNTWRSVLILGTLFKHGSTYDFVKKEEHNITLPINEKGRGMELSELLNFNEHLFAFDDRTGLVCSIDVTKKKAYPKYILMQGDGVSDKGMKIEWATIYKDHMYVGSIGKEFTTPTGEYLNDNPLFVKRIDSDGRIVSLNWKDKYTAIKNSVGIYGDGYMIHEAVTYTPTNDKWYFAPRKCSQEKYDDVLDETRACKYIVSTHDFQHFDVLEDPQHDTNRGFSTIKFLPHDEKKLVYLKSVEVGDKTETYIGMIATNGKILMQEKLVGKLKLEGIEFIPL
ncbi:Apyrase [Entamoeba marina]